MSFLQDERELWNRVVNANKLYVQRGRIHTIQEQHYISKGPKASIGDVCIVGKNRVMCEVVSIEKENNLLLPFVQSERIYPGDEVEVISQSVSIPSLKHILGTVLDANGNILNGGTMECPRERISLDSPPIQAFERKEIAEIFETGIRAIDTMLTIGIGQKVGIFAGSGVGKSTTLGMIAKNAKADINVIGLVGERGREVREFLNKELGEEGMKKSVIVVATSDESELMQLRCAKLATSIAEKFREQGNNVLLMMDSITRFADARKNIDIATKEFPVGGKTLLMQSYMKKLLERSGKTDRGSITGIYTVLVDGDDMNGPIPDLARGILDGHIVLSRELATQSHYPAIDVSESLSRVMQDIVSEEHMKMAQKVRGIMALYQKNETYFKLGTIRETEDNKHIFEAKSKMEGINEVLKQGRDEHFLLEDSLNQLSAKL